jgi:preprotein translocase subunit SecF
MINWMKHKNLYFVISFFLVGASLLSLTIFHLKPAIDFTGGALLEIKFNEGTFISTEKINESVSTIQDVQINSVQVIENGKSYIIRTNSINENKKNEIINKISESYPNPEEVRFETVGPSLGKELLIKTAFAVAIASILILLYIAYQFKDKVFGISAILAMFHDSIILAGAFALLGKFLNVEVDILFVTAVLTTLSFSVHDTIVVFDRIREKSANNPSTDLKSSINNSITETLPRSLNNSLTIIFMLLALALLGGSTIRWFVTALLIGTIVGTYSSTFVAAPLLLVLRKRFSKSKT